MEKEREEEETQGRGDITVYKWNYLFPDDA